MESSLAINHAGVSAQDLPEAAALFDLDGPFASVVIATQQHEAQAADRFAVAWGDRRRELHERGAPDDVLDRMEQWLTRARTDGSGLACIAAADGGLVGAAGTEPS